VPFTALIIDADGKTPATLKNILAPYGFEFTVTENGPEAVNVARQAAPDIILLRAELPLTTGFSVCNRLRRNEDTRKIPLVLYSSNASDDVIEQHRNLKTHADDYLKLPLEPERVLGAVRAHLQLPSTRPVEGRPNSRPETRAKPRLEVEIREPSGSRPPPVPAGEFDREFGAQFDNLAAEVAGDDERAHAARPGSVPSKAAAPRPAEPSGARRLSGPEPAATGDESSDGGFKAQREALQLKTQLNAKNREILALKDDLEARERAILDAKRINRELQAQAGELETQLIAAQEQILEAREAAEAAQRDKATVLKREEGLKTRLEVIQRRLRDTEVELAQARERAAQELAQTRDAAAAAAQTAADASAEAAARLAEAGERIDAATAMIRELEARLAARDEALAAARDEAAGLAGSLQQTRHDMAHALSEAHMERDRSLGQAAREHQDELEQLAADHQAAQAALQAQMAEAAEQARQEQARLTQTLLETEENARLQVAQLTQTLTATEESARAEIQRLTQALAAAEEHTRAEIQKLQQAAADAAEGHAAELAEQTRRIAAVEADIDELGVSLDRAETALHKRKEAAHQAQQALAVALRLLDDSGEAT
jgi:CheY-like chemotaxis protein